MMSFMADQPSTYGRLGFTLPFPAVENNTDNPSGSQTPRVKEKQTAIANAALASGVTAHPPPLVQG